LFALCVTKLLYNSQTVVSLDCIKYINSLVDKMDEMMVYTIMFNLLKLA